MKRILILFYLTITFFTSEAQFNVASFWWSKNTVKPTLTANGQFGYNPITHEFIGWFNGAERNYITATSTKLIWDDANTRLGIGLTPSFPIDIQVSSLAATRITNTGVGNVASVLKRTGGTASEWEIYLPSSSSDFRISNGSDRFTLTSTGVATFTGTVTGTSFIGNIPVTDLNSGTGASSSTYWRGDGTWSTPTTGVTNTAPSTYLMMSDGTNAVSSDVNMSGGTNYQMNIGTNTAGATRAFQAAGSATDISISLLSKGAGQVLISGGSVNGISAAASPSSGAFSAWTYNGTGMPTTGAYFEVINSSTGAVGNGIAAGVSFKTKTSTGSTTRIASIEAIATDYTNGSEDGDLSFKTAAGGVIPTEKLRVTNDGRLYGTALHNNAGAITGTANQYVASGTYTPTFTNQTNISSSTPTTCQYIRVGNVVTVSGWLQLTATAANTSTVLQFTLPPIATNNFGSNAQGGGTAVSQTTAFTGDVNSEYAQISTTIVNQFATMSYYSKVTGARIFSFSFTYLVP